MPMILTKNAFSSVRGQVPKWKRSPGTSTVSRQPTSTRPGKRRRNPDLNGAFRSDKFVLLRLTQKNVPWHLFRRLCWSLACGLGDYSGSLRWHIFGDAQLLTHVVKSLLLSSSERKRNNLEPSITWRLALGHKRTTSQPVFWSYIFTTCHACCLDHFRTSAVGCIAVWQLWLMEKKFIIHLTEFTLQFPWPRIAIPHSFCNNTNNFLSFSFE
jgi:hypothetical protein